MTRTHVSEKKLDDLETIEETAGGSHGRAACCCLTDGAWNALATLNKFDLCEINIWLRGCVELAEQRGFEDGSPDYEG